MHIVASVKLNTFKDSNVLADASVTLRNELGDLTFKKIRIVRGKDGDPFVALPQISYDKENNGQKETKYFKTITCSKDWMTKIEESVFAAYSEAMKIKKPVPAVA